MLSTRSNWMTYLKQLNDVPGQSHIKLSNKYIIVDFSGFFSRKEKVLDPSRTAFSFAEYMPRSKATERRTWMNWTTYLKQLNDVPEGIEQRTWRNWTTYLKELNNVPEGIERRTWRNWMTYLNELNDVPEGIEWRTWSNWMTYLNDRLRILAPRQTI